ncbi:hypothetical protein ACQJBY_036644 [Aegilops geniculata]
MIRSQQKDRAIDSSRLQNLGAIDRHGIHEVGGPFLVGGASLLNTRTGLFYDLELRHILTDAHRFQAYLEFREKAFEIAVTELMFGTKSPADLFLWVAADKDNFNCRLVEYILTRYMRHDGASSILQSSSAGTEVDNIRIMHYLPKDKIRQIEDDQKLLRERLSSVHRYFAYRKHLLKLDFIQSNSDPEDVLLRLKSSNRRPTLQDDELSHCLKSHIDFLKEYKRKRDPAFSIPEYENAASEKINEELSSGLQKHLDRYDWMLMEQYYDRMKLRGLARTCATQAQKTGAILVGEALPIREHLKEYTQSANPELKKLPWIEQAVKQSLQDYTGRIQEKFRNRAPLGKSLQVLLLGALGLCAWRQPTN